MDNKIIFADGLTWKRPSEITKQKAPWVKGHMSINVPRLRKWLDEHEDGEWLNVDLNESKEKKTLYFKLNTWKPTGGKKKNLYDTEPTVEIEEDVPLLGDEDINSINGDIDAEQVFKDF